jgi:hypothetical protein
LKPTQAKSSQDPISKKNLHERVGGVAQGVDPELSSNPSTTKKKKKKRLK